jgi:arylsulfatase A-like enzyme
MVGVIDVLPTLCGLAGVAVPLDRAIDGKDIWPLMTSPVATTPHEALFSMSGAQLATVRSGKWKLHVLEPGPGFAYQEPAQAREWVDPRGPDGVTLLAQVEQPNPSHYPGLRTGDRPKPMMLFDTSSDPAEQKDVAAQNPEVVTRLKALFDKMNADVPVIQRPERHGAGGVRRLTGGSLDYDRVPKPPDR